MFFNQKNRVGRRQKDFKDLRYKELKIRLTEEEYNLIKSTSKDRGKTMAVLIRESTINSCKGV